MFTPFLERFTYLHWRFIECGFDNFHYFKYSLKKQWQDYHLNYGYSQVDLEDDCEDIDDYVVPVVLFVLFFDTVSSLVVLILEVNGVL